MPVPITDIVQQMRSTLALSEPDLDTSIGTTTRKILDAVAEVISESFIDKYLLDYQYDIDSKNGQDLDDFVALFGFTRLPAKRATGTVIFERTSAATSNIQIFIGTQLSTEDSPPIIVGTILPATLVIGDSSIEVPVQAVAGGTAGNVVANSLKRRVTPIDGITSFANPQALTGGADAESDAQLRLRFKRTVFRNLAGTEQMFLGVALDDPSVTQANVVGASKRFREQIEIVAGTATSTIPDARFVYPDSSVFGANIDGGDIAVPAVQYTFNDTIPPSIDVIDSVNIPDGVYDLEFEYVSDASRNDPDHGITNRVDVFVNGQRPTEASSVVVFRTAKVFNTTGGDPLNRLNFERRDGTHPVAGNYFLQFPFAPVLDPSLSDEIIINGVTYFEGTHYFLVNDITAQGGTTTSLSGIELKSVGNGLGLAAPPDLAVASLDYSFNAVIRDVQLAIGAWRLITTDVKVHQAKQILLDLYLAVILQPGYTSTGIQPELENALSRYVDGVGFDGVVQVSDLLEVAHQVPGVDAVRFLTSTDNGTHYAIQKVTPLGSVISTYDNGGTPRRAIDVIVGDDELPVLNAVTLVVKAQNSFGAV